MYPTKALQNDQASVIFSLLWHVNRELRHRGYKATVTVGMLQRYIPHRYTALGKIPRRCELRLKCPHPSCNSRMVMDWELVRVSEKYQVFREKIICSRSDCPLNTPDPLVQEMCRMTREAVYSSPPDILIANPDILNARLNVMGAEDPGALTILGKSAWICPECGTPHGYRPRTCKVCGAKITNIHYKHFSYPRVIVVDEAHQMRGGFGAQVSHLLTRLEEAIRFIKGLQEWRPLYFISSATLNNPEERARELVGAEIESVVLISAKSTGRTETYRVHVFIMPKVYSPEATVGRIFEVIYGGLSSIEQTKRAQLEERIRRVREQIFPDFPKNLPTVLVFANTIAEVNTLLGTARSFTACCPARPRIDGHSTDFKAERVEKEDGFTSGYYHALIATSGLEVGVDFDRVDIGIIYRMPFYITDYTQRIGRIGRRQHCLIFNIFMPDTPVDYFYYKNWKLLCEGELRELSMRNETYRIDRDNVEAVKRSAKRSVIDYIAIQPDAERLLSRSASSLISGSSILQVLEDLLRDPQLLEYVVKSLRTAKRELAKEVAQSFANRLLDDLWTRGTLLRAVKATVSGIRSLRTIEEQVEYDIYDVEDRHRELSYAFRHCTPGQVLSYRGVCLSIDTIDALRVFEYPQRELESEEEL